MDCPKVTLACPEVTAGIQTNRCSSRDPLSYRPYINSTKYHILQEASCTSQKRSYSSAALHHVPGVNQRNS